MSGPQFTPGPWEAVGLTTVASIRAPSRSVANVQYGHFKCGREQALIDAHLIAAAPELYEALEAMLGIISDAVSIDISDEELREAHPEDRRFIKRARRALEATNAALAKAQGRSA